MRRSLCISVAYVLLSSFLPGFAAPFDASFAWPLKLEKQFSSGFGDSRSGRYHKGVDLRTGGREGVEVYAPEDGYVWQIKTSYSGYGKALYLRGLSGRTYVFFHLQGYRKDIGSYLQKRQIADRRYYQELTLEPKSLPVKQGQFVARSGQTGVGAPHLHFEVRDIGGVPTNPLYYSIKFRDVSPPTFQAVWLTYLDDSSLFENGQRQTKLIPVSGKTAGRYGLGDTIVVTGRFGVTAAIKDILGNGSFATGASKISLYVDGVLSHAVDYDRIDFSEDKFSLLDRDFDPAKNGYEQVYNLFRKKGNRLSNYPADLPGDGTFTDTVCGYHTVRIEASDPFDNVARLEFVFFFFPAARLLAPLDHATFSDSKIVLPFNDENSWRLFDSVAVSPINAPKGMKPPGIRFEVDPSQITLIGDLNRAVSGYKLRFIKNNQRYPGCFFSTALATPDGTRCIDSLAYELDGDAILFTARSSSPGINWLSAEVVTDRGADTLDFCKAGADRFSLFYRPDDQIRKIELIIVHGPEGYRTDSLALAVFRINAEGKDIIPIGPGAELALTGDNALFDDLLLQIRDTNLPPPVSGYFLREAFIVEPRAVAFPGYARLRMKPEQSVNPVQAGMYSRCGKDRWCWAGGKLDTTAGMLSGPLGQTGIYAFLADTTPPVISQLNIEDREAIKISFPTIQFKVDDDLSGFENDLNFNVTIDKQWMIPEFDPEGKVLTAKPHWRITEGRHTLQIEVRDRCHNLSTVTRTFFVQAVTGP